MEAMHIHVANIVSLTERIEREHQATILNRVIRTTRDVNDLLLSENQKPLTPESKVELDIIETLFMENKESAEFLEELPGTSAERAGVLDELIAEYQFGLDLISDRLGTTPETTAVA